MTDDYEVTVNGESRRLSRAINLSDLLTLLGIAAGRGGIRGLAVAVNDEVIPRSAHPGRFLQPFDRIEIIHPVGGG
jgi:sulfur carrier protein